MAFRTIEISDAEHERDHLRLVTVKSAALKGRGDISVFVPPGCETQALPIVILLHGVYGSHWAWALKGAAHKTALALIEKKRIRPMILAMPSDGLFGDGSGYVAHQADYESWIVRDVPAAVCEAAPQADSKTLFISGLSMGGFGALRLGGKFAALFRGISAHSSITHFSQMAQFVEEPLNVYGMLPESEQFAAHALIGHAPTLPPLRFDCGASDPLIEPNRALHRELLAAGVPHRYDEFSGGHGWEYWREHLTDSLLFFDECLRAPAKSE